MILPRLPKSTHTNHFGGKINTPMRNIRSISLALAVTAIALLSNVVSAHAQKHASASANAEAKIVSGISLAKTLDLKFGSIVRSAEGGTVTINPNGGEITYNGVTQGQNTSHQAAQFTATGEGGYLYRISLPNQVKLDHEGGKGVKMTVRQFTNTSTAGRLDDNGSQTFSVGATLEVEPNQATGKYTGTFDVTVQYE